MISTIRTYFILFLKGMAMGAADIVPGVSGGTIAFITNIYDELIDTISSINIKSLQLLLKGQIKDFWKAINGNFIVTLLVGIATSFILLANIVKHLLENEPILIWSFFFGLVLASIIYIGKTVKKWNISKILALILGSVFAYYLTILPPLGNSSEMWFLFVSGMIAICAMILPGISGSFILLILGSYSTFIGALKDLDFKVLMVFGTGCVIGLLSFSRVLKWMFSRFHDFTIALLTGFLIGSLNKLWPWKENGVKLYTHESDGRIEYFQTNISPNIFEGDPQIGMATLWVIIGVVVILGLEFLSKRLAKK